MPRYSEDETRLIDAVRRLSGDRDLHQWIDDVLCKAGGRVVNWSEASSLESPQREASVAHRAADAVADERPLTEDERFGLEAIVDVSLPVMAVIDDSFEAPDGEWRDLDEEPQATFLHNVIRATGRINFRDDNDQATYATGFLIGHQLLCTNRHVAQEFCHGLGQTDIRRTREVHVHFATEIGSQESGDDAVPVIEPVLIHPHWDCALLKVEAPGEPRAHLTFDVDFPDSLDGHRIGVVGHPKLSEGAGGFNHQTRLLGGWSGVKRIQPGFARPPETRTDQWGNSVRVLAHNASTLPANSGSAVVDLGNGRVLGIHIGGKYLINNYAVPGYQLARDRRVVDCGASFHGTVDFTDEWESKWEDADP